MNAISPQQAPAAAPGKANGAAEPALPQTAAAPDSTGQPAESAATPPEPAASKPKWREGWERLLNAAFRQHGGRPPPPTPLPDPAAPEPDDTGPLLHHAEDATTDGAPDTPHSLIPANLRQRYLITDDGKYYFRDRQQSLAFEDRGQRLHTSLDDADVATSMVELAQAKGWTQLKLRGSADFKRAAWLAAAERGLQVKGYRPQAVDRARLQERLAAQALQAGLSGTDNSIALAVPTASAAAAKGNRQAAPRAAATDHGQALEQLRKFLRQRGDSESAVAATTQLAAEQLARHRTYFGKLQEHGAARYQFKADNDLSYFVTLETPTGRETIWGADLERAIQESGANIGEGIVLSQRGSRPVTTTAPERDASGTATGQRSAISANRHRWELLSLDNVRDFGAPAKPGYVPGGPEFTPIPPQPGAPPPQPQQAQQQHARPAEYTPFRAR